MPFTRFVQPGRVALVNYGPEAGQLVLIVDVLDANRVLVDGPGQARRQLNLKRLALTDLVVALEKRGAKATACKKAWEAAKVSETFAASAWGKKLARRAARAALDDLGRHKALMARMARGKAARAALAK